MAARGERDFDPLFPLTSSGQNTFAIGAKLSLASGSIIVVTNVLLTTLIAKRILWLTQLRNDYLNDTSHRSSSQVTHLVAIILESGLLYVITLIVAGCLIPYINPLKLLPIVSQVGGIATTLIMVRVELCSSVEMTSAKALVV
ncbi:hypothetical protein GYMLUDRAFT_242985 [Collybiopsis luxurians FD-317 M1]|uniref:Uncharacterized protein n=1 Tax=Collybiopsis luxurians FD-317 M1 TaxID=944289 RepID=A0A0D0BEU7_9AGAR|nr:hypothetical protein GYMLUDRAFT_242985 [Collybiopsis luxurians FD-317 M1]